MLLICLFSNDVHFGHLKWCLSGFSTVKLLCSFPRAAARTTTQAGRLKTDTYSVTVPETRDPKSKFS